MKVLLMIDPRRDPETTGASQVGVILANALDSAGISVGIVTSLDDYSMFSDSIIIHEPENLNTRSINKDIINFAYDVYKKFNYDVLNTHSGNHTTLKWLSLLPCDINLVLTIHNSFLSGRSSIVYGPFANDLMHRSRTKIVSVSKYCEDLWEKFSLSDDKNHLGIIYNGINEIDLNLTSYDDRTYDLIMCSRIDEGKRTLQTIESMGKSGLNSLFIGDTYERGVTKSKDYYSKCLEAIFKYDNIKWINKIDNEGVINYLNDSKFLLDLSSSEACPMVVLESLYAGCKVLYPNYCPGIQEVLSFNNHDKVSYKIPFKPRTKWQTRYNNILEVTSRLINEGYDPLVVRKYYRDNFSIDRMTNSYINLYEELIHK